MSSQAGLDQLVKGSPPPNVSLPSVAASLEPSRHSSNSPSPPDPTLHIPASPPQIYLNLLILEASLRSQYLTLRARRRQNTFVLTLLAAWIAYFFYCQFLRPREDGTGVGGSVYWLLDMLEKVALISGVVMAILFRITGQFERGVRWPARWLRTTNRGLRGMNCKVVVLKGPWWKETLGALSYFVPLGAWVETPGSNYQFVEHTTHDRRSSTIREKRHDVIAEEDIAPGGDYVKLLLLPKHFTPEFRENWDLYRAEYWQNENQRRADLRAKWRARKKQWARQHSPWFWWVPGRSLLLSSAKSSSSQHSQHTTHHTKTLAAPSNSIDRSNSTRIKRPSTKDGPDHSRSSSRSSRRSSMILEPAPSDERERRYSSASTTSSIGGGSSSTIGEQRRRRKVGGGGGATESEGIRTVSQEKRASIGGRVVVGTVKAERGSRPVTPPSGSAGSSRFASGSGTDGESPRKIKKELVD